MYETELSRKNPGCFIVLLDRSDSMQRTMPDGRTMAQGAADAINTILFDMCVRSQTELGAAPRSYFEVGILGYGRSAGGDVEAVESAFGGALAGRVLVPLADLATNPLDVREVQTTTDLPPSKMPIWVEAIHGWKTPMCQAIATAGGHVADWVQAHPNSFPPIVINITDGIVTDSPFNGATLAEWGDRLRTLATNDGPALLFNVFLSPDGTGDVMFPTTDAGLPDPGPALFALSSLMPPTMIASARTAGLRHSVEDGARGMAFNVGIEDLVKILEIGTRPDKSMAS
jgi:hypothetical protein